MYPYKHTNLKPGILIFTLICGMFGTAVSIAQSSNYLAPRTVDNKPDLQGMWTSNTITPFSRSDQFEQLVLTQEQAIELEQSVAAYSAERDLPSDPDRSAPTKERIELADSYNNFWFDEMFLFERFFHRSFPAGLAK